MEQIYKLHDLLNNGITFFGLNFLNTTKFKAHRVGGFLFLVTYGLNIYCLFFEYETFIIYQLPVYLALLGFFQAVSATLTFTFLPKKIHSGYFSDKGVLSYYFIKENIYYQMITLFGSIYILNTTFMNNYYLPIIVSHIFLFLPYTIIRPFFPVTRLTYNLTNNLEVITPENRLFYARSTIFIKYFYLYGKHIMGFGFNYLYYMNYVDDTQMKRWGWLLYLLNTGNVSISIFMHTLRFKRKLSPISAFSVYIIMSMLSFIALPNLMILLFSHKDILIYTITGLLINMYLNKYIHYHYMITMGLMIYSKYLLEQNNNILL